MEHNGGCECPRCGIPAASSNPVDMASYVLAPPPKVLVPNPDDRERELQERERALHSAYLGGLDRRYPVWHAPVSTSGLVKWHRYWVDARRDYVLTGDRDALDRMRAYVTMDYPLLASDVPAPVHDDDGERLFWRFDMDLGWGIAWSVAMVAGLIYSIYQAVMLLLGVF